MQSATPLLTTWPLDLFFCMSICLPIALGFNDYRDTQPHEARFGGVCKSCNLGTVSHSSSVFSRLFPWGLQHHSRLARCSCRHSSVTIYTHRLSRGSLGGFKQSYSSYAFPVREFPAFQPGELLPLDSLLWRKWRPSTPFQVPRKWKPRTSSKGKCLVLSPGKVHKGNQNPTRLDGFCAPKAFKIL